MGEPLGSQVVVGTGGRCGGGGSGPARGWELAFRSSKVLHPDHIPLGPTGLRHTRPAARPGEDHPQPGPHLPPPPGYLGAREGGVRGEGARSGPLERNRWGIADAERGGEGPAPTCACCVAAPRTHLLFTTVPAGVRTRREVGRESTGLGVRNPEFRFQPSTHELRGFERSLSGPQSPHPPKVEGLN